MPDVSYRCCEQQPRLVLKMWGDFKLTRLLTHSGRIPRFEPSNRTWHFRTTLSSRANRKPQFGESGVVIVELSERPMAFFVPPRFPSCKARIRTAVSP